VAHGNGDRSGIVRPGVGRWSVSRDGRTQVITGWPGAGAMVEAPGAIGTRGLIVSSADHASFACGSDLVSGHPTPRTLHPTLRPPAPRHQASPAPDLPARVTTDRGGQLAS
jgi:hypothetical protein